MLIREDDQKIRPSVAGAPVVRFAPSPTGYLHIGNARGALLNYLFALKTKGTFILRIDDTDRARCRETYVDDIQQALQWLGYTYDRIEHQFSRLDLYTDMVEQLKRKGRLYACYETKLELEYKRKRQLAQKKPPIYDRACLSMTSDQKLAFEREGRQPYWRFKLEHFIETEIFEDAIRGDVKFNATSLSDPVLIREDGTCLYTLTSVVDDIDMKISHIIRGADHITNTGVQIQIFRALGSKVPLFAHFSLLHAENGQPLSKRDGALAIRTYEESGFESMALNNVLASLGREGQAIPFCRTLEELAQHFSFKALGTHDIPLPNGAFERANKILLQNLSYTDVKERLKVYVQGLHPQKVEQLWLCVRENLHIFSDIDYWLQLLRVGDLENFEEEKPDKSFCQAARTCLPEEPWDKSTWGMWLGKLATHLNQPEKNLYAPLRLLITGKKKGPPLQLLLPIIGFEKIKKRLE